MIISADLLMMDTVTYSREYETIRRSVVYAIEVSTVFRGSPMVRIFLYIQGFFFFFILYFQENIFFILYFCSILYSVFSWFCNSLFSIFKISIYLFCIFRNPYSSFSNNWFAFYHAHSTRNNVILSCYYIINIGHEKIDMFFVLEIVLF